MSNRGEEWDRQNLEEAIAAEAIVKFETEPRAEHPDNIRDFDVPEVVTIDLTTDEAYALGRFLKRTLTTQDWSEPWLEVGEILRMRIENAIGG